MSTPITTLIPYMPHPWKAPTAKQEGAKMSKNFTTERKVKRVYRPHRAGE